MGDSNHPFMLWYDLQYGIKRVNKFMHHELCSLSSFPSSLHFHRFFIFFYRFRLGSSPFLFNFVFPSITCVDLVRFRFLSGLDFFHLRSWKILEICFSHTILTIQSLILVSQLLTGENYNSWQLLSVSSIT